MILQRHVEDLTFQNTKSMASQQLDFPMDPATLQLSTIQLGTMKKPSIAEISKILASWLIHLKRSNAGLSGGLRGHHGPALHEIEQGGSDPGVESGLLLSQAEPLVDLVQLVLHSAGGEVQPLRDGRVGEALGDEGRNVLGPAWWMTRSGGRFR